MKRLDQDRLQPIIPTGDPTTFYAQAPTTFFALPIVCFFEDFVVIILSKTPTGLQPKAAKALEAIAGGLARHGMHVNDSPSKTEAMFHYHGQNSLIATQAQAAHSAQPNNQLVIRAKGKHSSPSQLQ